MIKMYSLLFAFISSICIVFYSFKYILTNIYYYFKSKYIRKFINKILPFFSKYNHLLLIIALISSILHILGIIMIRHIINTGYVVLFLLIIIFKFNFFVSKSPNNTYILNILSYLLLFSLLIHYYI